MDEGDVSKLAVQRSKWISFTDAANLVGCSEGAIKTAVNAGMIRQRDVHRSLPSLDRESVQAFATEWTQQKQRRAERAKPATGPPDDGEREAIAFDLPTSSARILHGIQKEALEKASELRFLWWAILGLNQ